LLVNDAYVVLKRRDSPRIALSDPGDDYRNGLLGPEPN